MLNPIVVIATIVLGLCLHPTAGQRVTSVSTTADGSGGRYGSWEGGARIYISGNGFSEDQYRGGNSVFVAGKPCTVISYLTTPTTIVCEAPPGNATLFEENEEVPLQVWVDFISEASCGTGCNFRYREDRTPIIKRLVPTSSNGASSIGFQGYLLVDEREDVREFSIGEDRCVVDEELTDFDDVRRWDSWATVYCQPGANVAGYYNITAFIDGEAGRAQMADSSFVLSPDETKRYQVEITPVITSISHSSGSTEGRLLLTVNGHGFSSTRADNVVDIDGAECEIVSSSATQIVCLTGQSDQTRGSVGKVRRALQDDSTSSDSTEVVVEEAEEDGEADTVTVGEAARDVFMGSRGMTRHYFSGLTGSSISRLTDYVDLNGNATASEYWSFSDVREEFSTNDDDDNYGQWFQGWFIAPVTGEHIFYVAADDHAHVWLSTDESPDNKEQIIDFTSWVQHLEWVPQQSKVEAGHRSEPVSLVAGNMYYIEAMHKEGGGGDHMAVGVLFPSDEAEFDSMRERQSISLSVSREGEDPPALAGTWTISFDGSSTPPLDHNINANDMETALEALTGHDLSVSRSGNTDNGATWTITFDSVLGDVSEIFEVSTSGLYGGDGSANPSGEVHEVQTGTDSRFMGPIRGDYLISAASSPQVRVTTNDILGSCTTDCSFEYADTEDSPTVTSVSGTSTLAITGTNFPDEGLSVYIGGAECDITSQSSTSISCSVNTGIVGSHPVEVRVSDFGLALGSLSHSHTFSLQVDSVSPSTGSTEGGQIITITGTGFTPDASLVSVTVGSTCSIVSTSFTEIVCVTGGGSTTDALVVNVNDGSTESTAFSYSTGSTPTVTSVSPNSGSVVLKTRITISGSGFSSSSGSNTVNVGSAPCEVVSASGSSIVCDTDGGSAGAQTVSVDVSGKGLSSGGEGAFTFILDVTSVSPSSSGWLGGNALTVGGAGFSEIDGDNSVTIDGVPCLIVTFSSTEITCIIPALGTAPPPDPLALDGIEDNDDSVSASATSVDAEVVVSVKQTQATCSSSVCTFQYDVDSTPSVTSIEPISTPDNHSSAVTDLILTVTGEGFSSEASENHVFLGLVECTVTVATETEIQCVVADDVPGAVVVNVIVDGKGYASSEQVYTHVITVARLFPNTGSVGGRRVTVQGSSFDPSVMPKLKIHNRFHCNVESIALSEIVCVIESANRWNSGNNYTLTYYPSEDSNDGKFECTTEDCNFTFDWDTSPKLTAVSVSDDTLIMSGDLFSVVEGENVVTVGGVQLPLTSESETELHATIAGIPAGTYPIIIESVNIGFAHHSSDNENQTLPYTYTQELTIDSVSPSSGSVGGGREITLNGKGFHHLAENNDVRVCNSKCEVTSASATEIVCTTGVLVNEQNDAQFQLSTPKVKLSGAYISSDPVDDQADSPMLPAMDGDISSYSQSHHKMKYPCWFGLDFGWNTVARIDRVKIFPRSDNLWGANPSNLDNIVGGVIEGSQDGETWELLYEFTERPNVGWTTIEMNQDTDGGDPFALRRLQESEEEEEVEAAAEPPQVRYIRYAGPDGSRCNLAEFQVFGALFDSSNSNTCDVRLDVATPSDVDVEPAVHGDSFEYSSDNTPTVTGLSPDMGSILGGTSIVLSGTGFSATPEENTVTIDGVDCTVTSSTSDSITCTTGARTAYVPASLNVSVSGIGHAVTFGHTFLYIDRWSAETTWGGQAPPREGETVHIPAGQNILLDVSPPKLKLLLIEGTLQLEDVDITLDAEYIFIFHGALKIGSEDEPFQSKAVITLHGEPTTPEIPVYGAKVIALRHGTLDVHGKDRDVTWTQLGATADVGSSSITLKEDVDWEAGEEIVIASSSFDLHEAEVRVIESVSGSTVHLTSPLTYKHYGELETYGNRTVDMRAEVGLLTRNVVIQGDENSAPKQFGGHVMIHSSGDDTSVGRFAGVEVRNAGQAFRLGRYPIHFHMIGNVFASYIKKCSVHDTFNRAVTIHGVHHLTIQDNVAYNNMGHAYFIEDGIETNNVLERNLGLVTRASHSLLNTDQTPATFWITNPNNILRNNAAGGSERYGYWYDLPPNPTGPSSTQSICVQGEHLGVFEDNTAHSNGRYGLRIFDFFIPRENPCAPFEDFAANPPVTANFYRLTGYKNGRNGAIGTVIGDVRFHDFSVADNKLAGIEVSEIRAPDGHAQTVGAVIVGRSNNDAGGFTLDGRGFIAPRSENYTISESSFYNFADDSNYAFGSCSRCTHGNTEDFGARTTQFSGITIENSPNLVHWGYPFKAIFADNDGSLTGKAGNHLTPYFPHNDVDACTHNEDINSLVCEKRVLRVEISDEEPARQLDFKDLLIKRLGDDDFEDGAADADGEASSTDGDAGVQYDPETVSRIPWQKKKNKGWAAPFVSGETYHVWLDTFADFESMTLRTSHHLDPEDFVYLKFNYTSKRAFFDVTVNGQLMGGLGRLPDSGDPSGSFFHKVSDKTVTVLINGIGGGKQELVLYGSECPRDGCLAPIPEIIEREDFIRNWNNATQWPEGRIPAAGEDVHILPPWRVLMNVQPEKIGNLLVEGELMFDENMAETNLEADTILVRAGVIQAGTVLNPFQQKATIKLHGERGSETLSVATGVDAGSKVLAVFGDLKLYGKEHNATWVHLAASTVAGDTQISVDGDISSWNVGDEIVVTTSDFDYEHSETATISTISGQSIELSSGLSYAHHGASSVESFGGVAAERRAEVGLLSRNVKIQGSDSGDEHGCHILVSQFVDILDEDTEYLRIGVAQLSNVEVSGCGHSDTARFALEFDAATNGSYVIGAAVHNSYNDAIVVSGTSGMVVEGNVVHDSIGSSIRLVSARNSVVTGNLASLARPIPITNSEQTLLYANFEICAKTDCSGTVVANNAAAGSGIMGFGFATTGDACETVDDAGSSLGLDLSGGVSSSSVFSNNLAHASPIGLFVLKNGACTRYVGFTGYNHHEVGVFMMQKTDLDLQGMRMLDNKAGISLNHATEGVYNVMKLRNSLIVGSSAADACTCGDLGCDTRFGVRTGTFITGEKPLPPKKSSLPWEKPKSDAAFGGVMHVDNVAFVNFNKNEYTCGDGANVVGSNPYQPDLAHPTHFSSIAKSNVEDSNLFLLSDPDPSWVNPTDCGTMDCTGLRNTVVTDADGSLTGIAGSSVINDYPLIAQPKTGSCTSKADWNAYHCADNSYRLMVFENAKEKDSLERTIAPVDVTSELGTDHAYQMRLNSFMDHRWDFDYTSGLRLSRFPAAVEVGRDYNVTFAGTNPRQMRFQLVGAGPDDAVVISIQYQSPEALEISLSDETGVKSSKQGGMNRMPTIEDEQGANYYEWESRLFHFTLRGPAPIFVDTIDAIHVSMTLALTEEEFFSSTGETTFINRLAGSLGIDKSRIRVVDIRAGSTVVNFQVHESEDEQERTDFTLQEIASQIDSANVDVGSQILGVDLEISQDPDNVVVVEEATDNTALGVGLGVGAACLIGGALALGPGRKAYLKRKMSTPRKVAEEDRQKDEVRITPVDVAFDEEAPDRDEESTKDVEVKAKRSPNKGTKKMTWTESNIGPDGKPKWKP